jgi:hypothetical protein
MHVLMRTWAHSNPALGTLKPLRNQGLFLFRRTPCAPRVPREQIGVPAGGAKERRHGTLTLLRGGQAGVVSFVQRFGSALQLTPHFHSLVPDGVVVAREGGACFEELPPPSQAEVARLLEVVHRRVLRLLERCGVLPAPGPEDALKGYQAASLQQRFRWQELDVRTPPRQQPRCAFHAVPIN